jgi:dTDP-4-amino-4,6-dideoxygalactose transaminase
LNNIKNDLLILPKSRNSKIKILNNKEHVWHLFVIRTAFRERLQKYLSENNIQTLIHYPIPPHKQKAFSKFKSLDLPVTKQIHQEVISLPISSILTIEGVNYIVDRINAFDRFQ